MERFDALRAALPTTEDISRYSANVSTEIAERLRQAQIVLGELTAVAATVPGGIRTSVAQAHRQLERHAPNWHQSVVQATGYEEAFFKPQTLEGLRYWVLDCGVDISKIDRSGYTPLSAVANEPPNSPEQKERIEFLIQCRVNINSQQEQDKRTPLHLLIANNNETTALFLIEYTRKTNHYLAFNAQDTHGDTPLILAIKMGQETVVLAILHEAKDSHAKIDLNVWNVDNESGLDCAINRGLEKIIIELLGLGAQCRKDNRTALHMLMANNHETIALSWINGTLEIANPIAFHRAFHSQDASGDTPLILAIKMGPSEVIFAILDKMKRHNTDIGLNFKDNFEKTALDYAYDKGIEPIIIALLRLGAKRHAAKNIHFGQITDGENTFLVPRNLSDLRGLVLSGTVDIHSYQLGCKLLFCAAAESPCSPDQEARIEFLLQLGVCINSLAVEEDNRTLLHFLIAKKNKASLLFLINYARKTKTSIDFYSQDANGDTPLILAIKMGQSAVVFAILHEAKEHNTDIGLDLHDRFRKTALDCAVILGEVAIIRALKKQKAKFCSISNHFSLLSEFDCPSMIKPILESANRDPNEEYEDEQGGKISLYEKCLRNQREIPIIFGSRLYQELCLMPLPPWRPYPYMPPLYRHMDTFLSREEKKKAREREEKDRKYMMLPP